MSIAEVAVDAMAVVGVNVTVAVVAMPFAWEPRVTAGLVINGAALVVYALKIKDS